MAFGEFGVEGAKSDSLGGGGGWTSVDGVFWFVGEVSN